MALLQALKEAIIETLSIDSTHHPQRNNKQLLQILQKLRHGLIVFQEKCWSFRLLLRCLREANLISNFIIY